MPLCPSCFQTPAIMHLTLGVLPCASCKARLDKLPSPRQTVEIIPERIKTERQERGDSIEQPHLKGELNKRWVDLWGESAARERGFSSKEIKNAKYVYDGAPGIRYYKDRT
jgi:hypothetical protein